MYNDPYNPELDPSKNPELAGEDAGGIAPGWEDVAAEADSPDAPPAFGSPESYRNPERRRRGTIGEDIDALRAHANHTDMEDPQTIKQFEDVDDPDVSAEEAPAASMEKSPEKELDEAEVEARFREYVMSLESEFNSVRNMSNDGLRRRIREEKVSLEQQLSGPDASADHELRIDLAVRKRAEAIFRNLDSSQS